MHDRASHRDLKSANVILARGEDPILIDLVGADACNRVISNAPRNLPA